MTRVQRIRHYDDVAAKASARASTLRARSCPDCKALLSWPDSVLTNENGQMVHYHHGIQHKHPPGSITPCLAYLEAPRTGGRPRKEQG
jgi:hypothetical protein